MEWWGIVLLSVVTFALGFEIGRRSEIVRMTKLLELLDRRSPESAS